MEPNDTPAPRDRGEALTAYLFNEVDPARRAEIEREMREDAELERLHRELRGTAAFMQRLLENQAPAPRRARLISAPAAPQSPARRAARRLAYPAMAYAAAAAVMFSLVSSTFSERLRGASLAGLPSPPRIEMAYVSAASIAAPAAKPQIVLAQAQIPMNESGAAPAAAPPPARDEVYRLKILKGAGDKEARDYKIMLESMGYLPIYIVNAADGSKEVYYGNFANRQDAIKMKTKLEREGFAVESLDKTPRNLGSGALSPDGVEYTILVGDYGSPEAASKIKSELEKHGRGGVRVVGNGVIVGKYRSPDDPQALTVLAALLDSGFTRARIVRLNADGTISADPIPLSSEPSSKKILEEAMRGAELSPEVMKKVEEYVQLKLQSSSASGTSNQALVQHLVEMEKQLKAVGTNVADISKRVDEIHSKRENEARKRVTIAQLFRESDHLIKGKRYQDAIVKLREVLDIDAENQVAISRVRMAESLSHGESFVGESEALQKKYDQVKAMAQQEESRNSLSSLTLAKPKWQQAATIHERYTPEAEARIQAIDQKIKAQESAAQAAESGGILSGIARLGRSIFGGDERPQPAPPQARSAPAAPASPLQDRQLAALPADAAQAAATQYDSRTAPPGEAAQINRLFRESERDLNQADYQGAADRMRQILRADPANRLAIARLRELENLARSSGFSVAAAPAAVPPPAPTPPDAMFFEDHGVNPFVRADQDSLSTFAIDVDTASYALARNYLERGLLPPAPSVRIEEIVNYFRDNYAPPANDAFAVYGAMAPSPFGQGLHLLRVGVKGREIPLAERKPLVLTFVVDVSGSMQQEGRLELVKRTLRSLVAELRPEDKLGMATFETVGHEVLPHVPLSCAAEIGAAIDRLQPAGSTNAAEGLRIGYDMARRAFDAAAVNRVILCSDGVANTGLTDADSILGVIEKSAGANIYLTSIGVGMGNHNDALLEKLADKGDGHYAYLDNDEEARRFLRDDLLDSMEVIAQDVKIQVEFNRAAVARYRLIGFENREVADADFRNDSVDAGEIGAGHSVTALYEIELRASRDDLVAGVSIRFKQPDYGMAVREIKGALRKGDIFKPFEEADEHFKLAACAAEFAEILRNSFYATGAAMRGAAAAFDAAFPAGPPGSEAAELRRLMELADAPTRIRPRPAPPRGEPRPIQVSDGPASIPME